MQCDEHKPVCKNCAYRQLACVYNGFARYVPQSQSESKLEAPAVEEPSPENTAINSRSASPTASISELLSRIPRSPFPDHGAPIADSALLAHYCKRTSLTLAAASKSDVRSKIWQHGLPSVACEHPSVSHGIAAVAAINIWCENVRQSNSGTAAYPSSSTTNLPKPELPLHRYLYQAEVHHGECLRLFQEELRSINEHNLDAVLACALLLVPCGLARSRVERHRFQHLHSRASHLSPTSDASLTPTSETEWELYQSQRMPIDLTWISLLKGFVSVQKITSKRPDWMRQSVVLPLHQFVEDDFSATSPTSPTGLAAEEILAPKHPVFQPIYAEGIAALSSLETHLASLKTRQERLEPTQIPTNLDICHDAISRLQPVVQQLTASQARSHRVLMIWPAAVDTVYIDLLAKEDVVAMAIFAHFCVYAILLEDLWWVDDLGVATIRSILEAVGADSESRTLFAWPARILELYENSQSSSS